MINPYTYKLGLPQGDNSTCSVFRNGRGNFVCTTTDHFYTEFDTLRELAAHVVKEHEDTAQPVVFEVIYGALMEELENVEA